MQIMRWEMALLQHVYALIRVQLDNARAHVPQPPRWCMPLSQKCHMTTRKGVCIYLKRPVPPPTVKEETIFPRNSCPTFSIAHKLGQEKVSDRTPKSGRNVCIHSFSSCRNLTALNSDLIGWCTDEVRV